MYYKRMLIIQELTKKDGKSSNRDSRMLAVVENLCSWYHSYPSLLLPGVLIPQIDLQAEQL